MLRKGRETTEGKVGELRPVAVIIGVGNRLRGDDAIGCLTVDALKGRVSVVIFDAETTPENYIEPTVEARPSRILFVDACDFGGMPGEFRLFGQRELERLARGMVSTHTLPLTMTAELLTQRTGAEVWLLGVQPAQVEFGAGMSHSVAEALPGIVRFISEWLGAETSDAEESQPVVG